MEIDLKKKYSDNTKQSFIEVVKKQSQVTKLMYGLSLHFDCVDEFVAALLDDMPDELKKRIRKQLWPKRKNAE